jgi:pyruvate dehydrogenase E2 component (dihydrolipoamide acetyltransferase)
MFSSSSRPAEAATCSELYQPLDESTIETACVTQPVVSSSFRRVPHLSSWRRLALRTWRAPRDPTVYGTLEIDVTGALGYLDDLRRETGVRVTLTHLVVRAIALALRRNPEANALVRRGWVYVRDSVDVFVQVVTDEGEDLGGIKVERADEKTLVEIAAEVCRRVKGLRAGRDAEVERAKRLLDRLPNVLLGPALRLLEWATFTVGLDLSRFGVKSDPFGGAMVSSIATFDIDWALAPIVPFSRCPIVLVVGRARPRPRVVEGRVAVRTVLLLGATFDHRLLDGAQASRLARIVVDVVSNPSAYEPPIGRSDAGSVNPIRSS